MEALPERPPEPQRRHRLRERLEPWFAILLLIPVVLWAFFSGAFSDGQPVPQREREGICLAIAGIAMISLCACLGPLVLAGFLALSALEASATLGAEIAFALLSILFWVVAGIIVLFPLVGGAVKLLWRWQRQRAEAR